MDSIESSLRELQTTPISNESQINPLIAARITKCEESIAKLSSSSSLTAATPLSLMTPSRDSSAAAQIKKDLSEFRAAIWKEIDNIWKVDYEQVIRMMI